MTQEPTAFGLLLGELSGILPAAQLEQVRAVFAGWAGQRIDIPTRRVLLVQDAERSARAALSSGAARAQVVKRLQGMGLPRSTAGDVFKRAARSSNGAAR